MEYELEELMPVVAKLTDKYTSKESSSVPYETARMLMEAVIYCVNECFQGEQSLYGNMISGGEMPEVEVLYEKGCEIVVEKAYAAKKQYETLLEGFEDYGCRNYRDTILKGMPGFFTRYDAKFNPQNQILTLDYPLLTGNPDLCGVDLILEYLKGIWKEKQLLNCFNRQTVVALLEKILPDYQSFYLENLCYPVLLNAIGCLIADKPIELMELSGSDYKEISSYFTEDDVKTIEQKIKVLIRMIAGRLPDKEAGIYFEKASSDYAARILLGLQEGALEHVIVSI